MLSILHIAAQSTTNSPGLSGLDPPTFNLDFEALKNLKVTLEKARGNTPQKRKKKLLTLTKKLQSKLYYSSAMWKLTNLKK